VEARLLLVGSSVAVDMLVSHCDVEARLLLVGSSVAVDMLGCCHEAGTPLPLAGKRDDVVMLAAAWAQSRRQRNRAMHAFHGNGGPPWQRVGRTAGEARLLQELNPVSKLRAAGWRIAEEVPDSYLLRVYDTRIDPQWLQTLSQELCGGPETGYIVGGDFLSRPHIEDSIALHPTEFRRWGPDGDTPYRLVVPPRPHVAAGHSAVCPSYGWRHQAVSVHYAWWCPGNSCRAAETCPL
jgi:hypothetical protein